MLTLDDRIARFVEALKERVPLESERDRFKQVLSHLVEWSTAHPDLFALNQNEHDQSVVSFRHAASGRVAWSAYPKRHSGAKLEIFSRARDAFSPGTWEAALETVKSLSKEPLDDDSTLRIPFTALKNTKTRDKAKELIRELIADLSRRDPGESLAEDQG